MSAVSIPTDTGPAPDLQSPVVVHDRRVTVDGITTQYLEAGSGSTLLLLHGHEQSATSWRWVIPALARTHHVLAPTRPASGPSSWSTAPGSAARCIPYWPWTPCPSSASWRSCSAACPVGTWDVPPCPRQCCSPNPGEHLPTSSPSSTTSDADAASSKPPPPRPAPCSTPRGNARSCSTGCPPSPRPPWSSGADVTT